jgi:hypothetical protein
MYTNPPIVANFKNSERIDFIDNFIGVLDRPILLIMTQMADAELFSPLQYLYSKSGLAELSANLMRLCSSHASDLEISEITFLTLGSIALPNNENGDSFGGRDHLNLVAKLFLKENNLPTLTLSFLIEKLQTGVYDEDDSYFPEGGRWPTLRYVTALIHPNASSNIVDREVAKMVKSADKLILRNWEVTTVRFYSNT